jgi:hypothetical protein
MSLTATFDVAAMSTVCEPAGTANANGGPQFGDV